MQLYISLIWIFLIFNIFPFIEDREDPALQEKARMAKVTARLQLENTLAVPPVARSVDVPERVINRPDGIPERAVVSPRMNGGGR